MYFIYASIKHLNEKLERMNVRKFSTILVFMELNCLENVRKCYFKPILKYI